MRVYIASKYNEYGINREIFNRLSQNGIFSFLPESINKVETSIEAATEIRNICINEIKKSTILLVIDAKEMFGSDVGWEVGYAYALKTELNYPIEIVNLKLNTDLQRIRAMNDPCFSYVSFSIDEMIDYLVKKQSVEENNRQEIRSQVY